MVKIHYPIISGRRFTTVFLKLFYSIAPF